ncbi:MAG: Large-conductance mechanosensitive channel [Phycisphaerales bacterium]|nr:Large-conductance mechanosensitive channel [Phycisphaerales bacterium]
MKIPLKTLWSEFKSFAFKGNMIDLAVAVVIGGAFGTVIKAMVDDVIMPAASYAVSAASSAARAAGEVAHEAESKVGVAPAPSTQPATTQSSGTQPSGTQPAATTPAAPVVAPPSPPPPAAKPPEQAVEFTWMLGRIRIGDFIGALLNFVIIAFAVFIVIVKILGSVMKKVGGTPKPSEPTTKECPECLSLIPFKAKRCAFCTAIQPPVPSPATPSGEATAG